MTPPQIPPNDFPIALSRVNQGTLLALVQATQAQADGSRIAEVTLIPRGDGVEVFWGNLSLGTVAQLGGHANSYVRVHGGRCYLAPISSGEMHWAVFYPLVMIAGCSVTCVGLALMLGVLILVADMNTDSLAMLTIINLSAFLALISPCLAAAAGHTYRVRQRHRRGVS
ncbi:MAG: hypothetical protein Q4D83_04950 [Corynebacterium sp.]|nr:hypothetical protein [Corynebacterium sp.]